MTLPFGSRDFARDGLGVDPEALVRDAVHKFKDLFERPATPRRGRGDVRAAVLSLLAEQPMHGYQLIGLIAERSGGTWKPSPGSVYPTLQLLSDEGLITAVEEDGRKTYSLTDAGRAEADASGARGQDWMAGESRGSDGMAALTKAGIELADAAASLGRTGSAEQVERGVEVLRDARRRLFAILAED